MLEFSTNGNCGNRPKSLNTFSDYVSMFEDQEKSRSSVKAIRRFVVKNKSQDRSRKPSPNEPKRVVIESKRFNDLDVRVNFKVSKKTFDAEIEPPRKPKFFMTMKKEPQRTEGGTGKFFLKGKGFGEEKTPLPEILMNKQPLELSKSRVIGKEFVNFNKLKEKDFVLEDHSKPKPISISNLILTEAYFKYSRKGGINDPRVVPFLSESHKILNQMHHDKILTTPNIPKTPSLGLNGRPILALDLDETLVFCQTLDKELKDNQTTLNFTDTRTGALVRRALTLRPHLKVFLRRANEHFDLVTFSASNLDYCRAVCKRIDPRGQYFKKVLARDSCVVTERGFYTKDLRAVAGHNISKVLLVDNCVQNFAAALNNGIPILPFTGESHDNELLKLADFLEDLKDQEDFAEYLRSYFNLHKLFKVNHAASFVSYLLN